MEVLQLETGAGKVCAEASGPADGQLVLALHGYGQNASARSWRYLLEPLGRVDCRVVSLSMPGFGDSPGDRHQARSEYALLPGGAAIMVMEIAIMLGGGAPVVLIGYDWGASLALAIALVEPNLVSGLVVFHSPFNDAVFPFNSLSQLVVPTLVLWVKVEQNHPMAHGKAIASAIPGAALQILLCGPYNAAKPKNNYEIIGHDIAVAVLAFVDMINPRSDDFLDSSFVEGSGLLDSCTLADETSGQASGLKSEARTQATAPSSQQAFELRTQEALLGAFRRFDYDGDGLLDEAEFHQLLSTLDISEEDIAMIVATINLKTDCKINFEDFLQWVFGQTPATHGSAEDLDLQVEEIDIGRSSSNDLARDPAIDSKAKTERKTSAKAVARRHRTTTLPKVGTLRWGYDHNGPAPVDVDPEGHGLIEPAAELRTVHTRGGAILVQLMGAEAGFPMVILHGWGRCSWSRDLQYLFAPLAELGYRIIAPDFPGFGRTRGKRWCSRSETNYQDGGPVQILEDLLENLAPYAAKLDVIGWSWGGGIACSFALKHQMRLRNLILWQGSYTDKDNELRKLKQPTLIVWVPVDQVHPVSLGRHYKEEFPNSQMIELKVGAFKPEKGRHCYEACSDKVLSAIVGWLRARQDG